MFNDSLKLNAIVKRMNLIAFETEAYAYLSATDLAFLRRPLQIKDMPVARVETLWL